MAEKPEQTAPQLPKVPKHREQTAPQPPKVPKHREQSPRRRTETAARTISLSSVKVLLLTFRFNDLEDVETQTDVVAAAFRGLNYSVERAHIPMRNSLARLKEILEGVLRRVAEDALLVIYYAGHGGLVPGEAGEDVFGISSHNHPETSPIPISDILAFRDNLEDPDKLWSEIKPDLKVYQPIASIPWQDISGQIMAARCDTLVILDCCYAGLAAVTDITGREQEEPKNDFRKELIGACSWGTGTRDNMSPALCESLQWNLKNHGDSASVPTIVRRMNNTLARGFLEDEDMEHFPQAVHYILCRTRRDKIILRKFRRPRH